MRPARLVAAASRSASRRRAPARSAMVARWQPGRRSQRAPVRRARRAPARLPAAVGHGGGENDGSRGNGIDGALDRRDGSVRPEQDDPPTRRPQRDAEQNEWEVVPFARGAGEQRDRPGPSAPASGHAEQAAAEEIAREVLVGDRQLAGRPAVAEPAQGRSDDLAEDGLRGEGRERAVEDRRSPPARRSVRALPAALRRCPASLAVAAGSGAASPSSAACAASAADSPCPRWFCIRRTRSSSASE